MTRIEESVLTIILYGDNVSNLWLPLVRCVNRDDGLWKFPGGGVNPYEPSDVAACREVLEETGIHILPEQLRLLGTRTKNSKRNYRKHIRHVYLVQAENIDGYFYGKQVQDGEDILINRMFPLATVLRWIQSKDLPTNREMVKSHLEIASQLFTKLELL